METLKVVDMASSESPPVARRLVDALSSPAACRSGLVVGARSLGGMPSLVVSCELEPAVDQLSSVAACIREPAVGMAS